MTRRDFSKAAARDRMRRRGTESVTGSTTPAAGTPSGRERNSAPSPALAPIEIGRFNKNQKGDFVVVQIKQFEGFTFLDVRQFFTGEDGKSFPTKKGVDHRNEKSARTNLNTRLNEMAGKHRLGLTDKHVWAAGKARFQ
jgi:hypothetical protein